MEQYLLISDAAKMVQVESHVLRYWEEELKLPIKRNELGHRYYTNKDIERFVQIKTMKERGLQLKAIKMILKNGKLDMLSANTEVDMVPLVEDSAQKGENEELIASQIQGVPAKGKSGKDVPEEEEMQETGGLAIDIVRKEDVPELQEESKEEKAKRLQWLLQQLIRETLQENNKELCAEIRDCVVKELDYQFRCQEERDTEREKIREKRNEDYYKKMDELLRKKSRGFRAKKKKTPLS